MRLTTVELAATTMLIVETAVALLLRAVVGDHVDRLAGDTRTATGVVVLHRTQARPGSWPTVVGAAESQGTAGERNVNGRVTGVRRRQGVASMSWRQTSWSGWPGWPCQSP